MAFNHLLSIVIHSLGLFHSSILTSGISSDIVCCYIERQCRKFICQYREMSPYQKILNNIIVIKFDVLVVRNFICLR